MVIKLPENKAFLHLFRAGSAARSSARALPDDARWAA